MICQPFPGSNFSPKNDQLGRKRVPIVSRPRTKRKEFRDGFLLRAKTRKADLEELGFLPRRGDGLFAFVQMDCCVSPKILSGDGAGPSGHKVDRMAGETQVRARRNAIERESSAQFRKFSKMFAIRSRLVRQRDPIEVCRVHENRMEIALARIDQRPPVYPLPDCFVSVLIHFCAIGLERGVHALGKCAVLGELGGCLFELLGGE